MLRKDNTPYSTSRRSSPLIRFIACVWIGGMLQVVTLTSAQSPESASTAAATTDIQQLIEQLQAGSKEQRDQAEASLISLGGTALEHLPQVNEQTSEELRLRLMRIRHSVPANATSKPTSRLAPSLITLSGTKRLSEVFEAFESQTGNRVVDLRGEYGGEMGDPKLKIDFENKRYLEALDQVLGQAGMKLSLFSGTADSLGVVNRDAYELPPADRTAYDGVFRVEATRIESIRDLANPNNRAMRLDLVIGWEPQQVPMTFRFDPTRFQATYDNGEVATVREQVQPFNLPVQEAVAGVELNVPFELPSRQATQIRSLTGMMEVSFPGARQELQFTNLPEGSTAVQQAGNLGVSVERVRRNGPIVDVVLSIRFDVADDPLSAYRGWVFQVPAVMIDGRGKRHEYVGLETMFQRESSIVLAYKYEVSGPLDSMTLAFSVPSSIVTEELRFELENLDLP